MKSSIVEENDLIDGSINNQNARIRQVYQDIYDEDDYAIVPSSKASRANTSTNAGASPNHLTQLTPFLMRKFLKK